MATIDDLEDLAANIFENEDPTQQRFTARQQKMLKKQQRKEKIKNKEAKIQQQKQQQIDDTQVQFQFQQKMEKVPGTQSIYVKTFGCSHNISDSEFMIGQLADYGYNIVPTPSQADLILINSCTVKNPSQSAFLNQVIKAKKIKKPVVVAGCVPQGDRNIPELTEVSALGVTQIDRVVEVVQETLKGHKVQLMENKGLPSLDLPKIRKNKDIEIIPINAGCLGACTYCKTVFARGKLLSYDASAITSRVNSVVKEGVKQIWLTSEDTGAYGRDINSNISELLISLCQQLKNHDKIMMRIGMTNPPYMLDHLNTIAHFLNHPRVYSFVHIPVQAGHNNVLNKMNRQYTVQQFKTVCDYFIEHVPDVTIATDIICGFPECTINVNYSETEEQFQSTMDLINEYKFKVVYINQFYLRPGTPAANFKQVPTHIIKDRSTRLSNLFKSFDSYSYMIGKQYRVWINEIEDYKGEKHLVGHTKNYTKVNIPYIGNQQLLYKQIKMKITRSFDWHVEGQIIERELEPVIVEDGYAQKMREDLLGQKLKLEQKKTAKKALVKEKKEKIMQEMYAEKQVQSINKPEQKKQSNKPSIEAEVLPKEAEKETVKGNNLLLYVSILFFIMAAVMHLYGF